MLGQRLVDHYYLNKNVELFSASFEEKSVSPDLAYRQVDIADKRAVKNLIKNFYPDVIINAAAYTGVDKCEDEKELAWSINVDGVGNLAKYASISDSKLIHMSTDYVFDGTDGPYAETAPPEPVGYYGRTKLASENLLQATNIDYAIIRTNVLYGPAKHGRNDFVKWVITSLRGEKPIRIVTDQINNPTYIDDLVQGISKVIEYKKGGIYNIGGPEFLSRYEFTHRIADYFDLNKDLISPIKTEELKQKARRPLKSGLITLKAETELNYKPLSIEESFLLMKKELSL